MTPSDRAITPIVVKLGPKIISDFQRRREAEGRVWAEGYTQDDLDRAQAKFGIRFPPDLVALFLERRPVLGWDWRSDEQEIRSMLERPYQGLLFDVERCGLWWPEWGDRPVHANERAEVLLSVVRQAPKLVPLLSHRYVPSEPYEAGNPVFSIHQSDVIYYGMNLADYFEHELGNGRATLGTPTKHIRFWSDLVDRAYQAPFYPGPKTD